MLTVKQAAERACVCESVIRSWIAKGMLPHYRLGKQKSRGKILIAEEDIDDLVAGFKIAAKEAGIKATPPPNQSEFRHLNLR